MSRALSVVPASGPTEIIPAREVHREMFSISDVQTMAEMVAKSGLFPGIANAQAACTLMLLCQAEGLHPMQAMKRYHIIEGKPAMRADAMLSEFLARGGRVKWLRNDGVEARAMWSHEILCKEPLELFVSLDDLTKRGITTGKYGVKDNYKRDPGAMCRARLIAMAVRMIDPGCITGMYTPEELSDLEPESGRTTDFPQNDSGHGRGQYASPDQVAAYSTALDKIIAHFNQPWLDGWQVRNGGQPHPGVKDLFNKWQVDAHLLKWATETGRLDPKIITDETASAKHAKYVAIVYHRGKADLKALKEEIKAYAAQCMSRESEALVKKYPELKGPDDEVEEESHDESAETVAEPWREMIASAIGQSQSPDEDFEAIAGEILDSLVKSKAISRDFETNEKWDWDRAGAHLEHYHTRDEAGFRRAVERAAKKLGGAP